MSVGPYLRAAFFHPLHLIVLLLATILAAASEWRWVLLPALAAAEILYLLLVPRNAAFRLWVNARRLDRAAEPDADDARVRALFAGLPAASIEQFKALRSACVELHRIGKRFRTTAGGGDSAALDELELESLDRLLWTFARLLAAENALTRFLEKASIDELRRDVTQLEARLQEVTGRGDDPQAAAARKVLDDNLATSKTRLENALGAARQCELIRLEIERLEDKTRTLIERGISRPGGATLRDEIEQTVASMVEAERAAAGLQGLIHLEPAGNRPPRLIARERVQGRH